MDLSVNIKGVGRDSDTARTILVMCDDRPSDDDLRALHDLLCGRPIHALPDGSGGNPVVAEDIEDRMRILEPFLHRNTVSLVRRFAVALLGKLRNAEQKYGYFDGWAHEPWEAECQRQLAIHVQKGDPLDVAAYAAFCWQRGWTTAARPGAPTEATAQECVARIIDPDIWASVDARKLAGIETPQVHESVLAASLTKAGEVLAFLSTGGGDGR